MNIEKGTADREQEVAFDNHHVKKIVSNLLTYADNAALLVIAREAVIRRIPASRETLRVRLGGNGVEAALVEAAFAIAEAGAMIEREGDDVVRERRKGALLERLVYSLVCLRAPDCTSRETHVLLTANRYSGRTRTGRKDVVVDSAPFEVYECKFGGGIEQWELDELGDVYLTAVEAGVDARPCIATMASMEQLQKRIAVMDLQLRPRLYFAGLMDLPFLAKRPPSQQVA